MPHVVIWLQHSKRQVVKQPNCIHNNEIIKKENDSKEQNIWITTTHLKFKNVCMDKTKTSFDCKKIDK